FFYDVLPSAACSVIQPKAMPQARPFGGHPIPIPSNRNINDLFSRLPHLPHYTAPAAPKWETFALPDESNLYDPRKTAAEAEKDLRNLMEGNFESDKDNKIDEDMRKVPGFREDITLLDHQVLGRIWMTERETGKKMGG